MPQPKKPTTKQADKPAAHNLTPDETDAILRDPNAPDDVRIVVQANYNVNRYLDSVEFHEDDNGYVTVRPVADAESTAED